MRIAPFSFKEFDAGAMADAGARPGMQPLLPGGRRREEVPPPPPPPPTFNEAELQAAKQESYKQGFEAGVAEGRAQAESEQAAVDREIEAGLERFVTSITPLLEDYRRFALEARQAMPQLALAIARKATAGTLDAQAQTIVENVAADCCQTMITEPKLVVAATPSHTPALEKKLKALATRLQSATDIQVIAEEGMQPGDCRIEWRHGRLERDTAQLWQKIEQAVADMTAAAAHTTDVHMEQLAQALPAAENNDPQKE